MIVESQNLFAFPETNRFVSLVKRMTAYDGEVWDIVLDGTNTDVSFTQELMDEIGKRNRLDYLDDIIIAISKKLTEHEIVLTNTEKCNLKKLMGCLT